MLRSPTLSPAGRKEGELHFFLHIFTTGFNSQQAGFAPILGFFAIGLIGLLFVRVPRVA